MIIREASENDLESLLSLYQFLFSEEDYSKITNFEDNWSKILKHDGLTYFVAIENGVFVATCNISITPNLSRGQRPYALIENVITHPDYRRRGFGKSVVKEAIDFAKSKSCYKVMLLSTASEDRMAVHQFYENIGFDGNSKRGFHIRF